MPPLGTGIGISRSRPLLDGNAAAFIQATGITNPTQQAAVNTLVISLKAVGLWSLMYAIYPFVGGNATAHSYNLKNTAQYQGVFFGTVTHNSNGITGDGATGYMNTSVPLNVAGANNLAYGIYSRLAKTDASPLISAIGSSVAQLHVQFTDNNYYVDNANDTTGRITGVSDGSTGLFTSSRTSAALHKAYRNGNQRGLDNTGAQGTLDTSPFFILSYAAVLFASQNIAWAFISDGLSSAQNLSLYTIVQQYQTSLGRQV